MATIRKIRLPDGSVHDIGGGSGGTVDQTYNSASTNAQSGTAVAEAIATVPVANKVDKTGGANLSGTFAPTTDNGATLGTSSNRFDTVYGQTADFEYYDISYRDIPLSTGSPGEVLWSTYEAGEYVINRARGLGYTESNIDGNYWAEFTIGAGGCTLANLRLVEDGLSTVLVPQNHSSTVVELRLPSESGALALTSDIPTIPDASTTTKGIVQLSDSVTSTSQTTAPTSNALNSVYEMQLDKVPKNGAQDLSGIFEPTTNKGASLGRSSYQFNALYVADGHIQELYLANDTTPTITYDTSTHRVTIPVPQTTNTTAGNGQIALFNAKIDPTSTSYTDESFLMCDALGFQYSKGTTSTAGTSYLVIGNNIATGNEWNSAGGIVFYNNNGNNTTLRANHNSTSNYTVTLPNKTGTLACTSDIPSVPSLPITVANGGTGATSASSARTNLGLGSAATYGATSSVTSGSSSLVTSGGVYIAIQPTDISSYITISSSINYSSLTKSANYSAVAGTVSMQIEFTLSAAIAASTSPKTVAVLSSASYRPPTIIVGIATDSGNKTAFPIIVTSAGSIQLYNNPAIGSGSILRLNATWCV